MHTFMYMCFLLVQLPPPPPNERNPPEFVVDNRIAQEERLIGGALQNAVNGKRFSVVAPSAYEPLRQRGPEVCQV